MTGWQTLNLSDLLPSELEPLVNQAGNIAQSISGILSNMASVVDTITPFIVDYVDPVEVIVQSFVTEVQNFLSDLKNTGVYLLAIPGPKTVKQKQSTDKFFEVIENSFYDVGDPDRPQFSESASIAGVVVLVGSFTFSGIANDLNKLGRVFGIKDFSDVFRTTIKKPQLVTHLVSAVEPSLKKQNLKVQTTEGFVPSGAVLIDDEIIEYEDKTTDEFINCRVLRKHLTGAEVTPGWKSFIGEPPDWNRTKVIDLFPSLGNLLRTIESFVNNVLQAPKVSQVISNFSNLLQDKANTLSTIASYLNVALNNLVNDFPETGFNILKIAPVTGGNRAFIETMKNGENKPQYSEDAYTAGIVIVTGSAGYEVLEKFF
ncbi:MAG: hypothetical protein AB1349_01655 [Elusimicrobiota bacterium]